MTGVYYRQIISVALLPLALIKPVLAEEVVEESEAIEVIGITPTHGVGLPEKRIPYNIQSANSEDLEASKTLDLADFMNRHLGNVTVNESQVNPLQPDIQYRGFSASPLLGIPQGRGRKTVYASTKFWVIPLTGICCRNHPLPAST